MDRIRLKVFGLSYNSMSQTGAYALVLAEENDTFRIPIIIGIAEAQSIAIHLEHLRSQRPLTHDLKESGRPVGCDSGGSLYLSLGIRNLLLGIAFSSRGRGFEN